MINIYKNKFQIYVKVNGKSIILRTGRFLPLPTVNKFGQKLKVLNFTDFKICFF